MDNIVVDLLKRIAQRITNKTSALSISPSDTGGSISDVLLLLARTPAANPFLSYPLDYISRDETDLYISIRNNVLGDVSVTSDWRKLTNGGAGLKEVYSMAAEFNEGWYSALYPGLVAYSQEHIYIVTPDAPNSSDPTEFSINVMAQLPLRKVSGTGYSELAPGDFSNTSFIVYRGSFFLLMTFSGGGTSSYGGKITDTDLIDMINDPGNWADALNSIWLGGPVIGREGSYYVNTSTTPSRPGYETVLMYTDNGTDLYPVRKVIIGV